MIDMFGGVVVGLEVLWHSWGEWGLESTRNDTATPYSVTYL